MGGGPPAIPAHYYSGYETNGGPAPANLGAPVRYEEAFPYGAKPLGGPSAWVNGGGAGGGAVDVRSSGITAATGAGAGGGGVDGRAGSRQCIRILSEAVAAKLSVPVADAAAALSESRQPLLRRFLAEGLLPAGDDRGGSVAESFLKTLEEQLPPVLSHLAASSGGGGAAEEEVKLVLSTVHWALLSRVALVALRGCRLLNTFGDLLQQHSGASWGGGGAAPMSRVVWDWLSARTTPPAGGAIGAALSFLQQHGVAGEHASEVSSAIASFMYEFSGRGRGLRQLFAVEIPARGGSGRGGGLLLLSRVVEAMGAHSATTREALVRLAVLQELHHTAVRDDGGGGGAPADTPGATT